MGVVLTIFGRMIWPITAFLVLLWPSAGWTEPSVTLRTALSDIVEQVDLDGARAAFLVRDLSSGEDLLSVRAEEGLMPASTVKVVTTAAALKSLGPSYRFTTTLSINGTLDGEGVLHGDLFVVGGGDPTLVVEKLWKMVLDLRLAGVSKITGDVIFDTSFFSNDEDLVGWNKPEDIAKGPSYFPKLSALSLNFNTTALVVTPGGEVGSQGRVVIETPVGELIAVETNVVTSAPKTRRKLSVTRRLEAGQILFSIEGRVPLQGGASRVYRTVPQPTAHFIAAFKHLLERESVQVQGSFIQGKTDKAAIPLVVLRSPTLGAVIMDMNKYSSNFIAEMVLRTMGAEAYDEPGSNDNGLRVVGEYLTTIGIREGQYSLVNGSGLSRDTRMSARQLSAVLIDMARDPIVGAEFVASLSIGGGDGTLSRRFGEADGAVRGKTGTLDGVHGLVGYVSDGEQRTAVVSFLANELPKGSRPAREVHEEIIDTIRSSWHIASTDEAH
jgi:D-alanyl-D-alanine carboxypeptidase/D-alanyl-D-alanine-endopeptidase (penicillin-binding protein 4)